MTRQRVIYRTLSLAVLACLVLLAGSAAAQTSPNFDLTWHVVANGGGTTTSANFRVDGTIGQALPGPPVAASASYIVTGGFWAGSALHAVYLPAILRG